MRLRAGDRLGPYEIEGGLGSGGMGLVFRARDPRLERRVAIKVILPAAAADADRLRRFEQEARACGSLSHPNILAVYDVGSCDGAPYLVTELLEGETLDQGLSRGALPCRKAVDLAAQVARGLAAAHERGIVHRDFKPGNLFVTRDGVVKILDFGLARLIREGDGPDEDSTTTAITGSGVVLGTVGYMSPEQARGQAVDHRSDVFSFGTVLYEMLAGRRAFQGASAVETQHAILCEEPPELPAAAGVPPSLDRLVRHCLEKKPEDRYQSMRDVAFELAGATTTSSNGRTGVPVSAGNRGVRWGLALAAAGLLVLASVGSFVAGRRSEPPPGIPSYRLITFRRGFVGSGRFTADGRSVVYAAQFEDAREPEIFSVRTDVPDSRALGFSGDVVGVSSKDELAFIHEGVLARVPMAGGQPRPVADNVACADWAPDGEGFAAVRTVERLRQLEYPLGTVLARQKDGEDGLGCPRFSPRGDRLALGVPRFGYRIFDLATGRVTSVGGVDEVGHEHWFAWAPGGDEIWFSPERPTDRPLEAVTLSGRRRVLARMAGEMSLYDVSRDGAALVEHAFRRERVIALAPGEAAERDLSIFDMTWISDLSADGRYVLVTERGSATEHESVVYLRPTDGSPPMRLAEDGMAVALSPDARWALVRPAMGPVVSKWTGLRVVPTGPGQERRIDTPARLTFGLGTWVSGDRVVIAGHDGPGPWHEYLLDVKAGTVRALTTGETGFCADGPGSVACEVDGRRWQVFPYAGGASHSFPWPAVRMFPRRLSADEKSVFAFVPPADDDRASPGWIERYEPETGKRVRLHQLRPPDIAGFYPYYVFVTADGRGYAYGYIQVLHNLYVARGMS
jgi:hypothetical protein